MTAFIFGMVIGAAAICVLEYLYWKKNKQKVVNKWHQRGGAEGAYKQFRTWRSWRGAKMHKTSITLGGRETEPNGKRIL